MQNNKMKTCLCILCVAAAALMSSCSKTPKGVIPEKDMAVLLADMAEGDAVVELNRSDYGSDESRKALKQSILIKNGYTQADFDKSLMWYGHNLDVYGDVYDDVVSILEDRQRDARNEAKKVGEKLVAAGDSVDVWQQSHSLLFDRRQCGGLVQLAFSYPADSEMRTGDRYEWRMQMVNAKNAATLFVGVDYADGSSEFQSQSLMPEETASIVLQTDSTRTTKRVYGYMNYKMVMENAVFVDKSRFRARACVRTSTTPIHISAGCATDKMRFLAPYTVYEGAVCRLHLFDISSDGSVSHRAVEEETAYTLYVQGIAVVAAAGIDTALISERIRKMEGQGVPLAEISRAIAGMNLPAGTDVYVATFPFQTLQRIG